ncbi:MAG: lipocalin-like domain-containing protein, partial [Turicibacter sp.]
YINHGKDITNEVKVSRVISLNPDGSITGDVSGTWELKNDYDLEILMDNILYTGVVTHQYNEERSAYVMTFSALSDYGVSIWGSQVVSGDE